MDWILLYQYFFACVLCGLMYLHQRSACPARLKYLYFISLGIKISCGIAVGLVYRYHYHYGDTIYVFNEALTLKGYILEYPGRLAEVFLHNDHRLPLLLEYDTNVISGQRHLFFLKTVVPFCMLTGGSYWLTSVCFSLFYFVATWRLIASLERNFPGTAKYAIIAFFLVPGTAFWSSGMLKEPLALGAINLMTAISLEYYSGHKSVQSLLLFTGCLLVVWGIKFYYLVLALPFLSILVVARLMYYFPFKRGIMVSITALGIIGLVYLYKTHGQQVLMTIRDHYDTHYRVSKEQHETAHLPELELPGFTGSLSSFMINIPNVLFTGFFRPMIGEATHFLQRMASIENAVLLFLFLGSFGSFLVKPRKIPIPVWLAIIYCLSAALLLTFSTPNLGTLARYRVAYMPFFVLICLLGIGKKQPKM